ncbi:imelysin family protein [Methylocella sp.]|uniref:imelysin family protein n=1 Tax=Methylocella sp. TaxID=1978226 RepID=UPI0035B459B3
MIRTLLSPAAGLAFALGAALAPAPAGAAPALDPAPLIETWLLPRYGAFAEAAAAQKAAWGKFCAAREEAGVGALKDAYGAAADAWNAVEFVTFGPVSQELRADRIDFFPDRRNAIARALSEILADPDEARLAPERFSKSSAAAQGLPALERLLYDEGAAAALAGGADGARRCALGSAVAGNLADVSAQIRDAWGDRSHGLMAAVAAGKGDPDFFPDAAALPGMILTDLSGAFQRVNDTKITPVLSGGHDDARPALADSWRSGRSGRVVANMVRSADALLKAIALQMPARTQGVVNKAANAADAAAQGFPADLGAAAGTPDGAAAIAAAVKIFKAAQLTVYRPIASYFGVSLGFNALDGD